MGPSFQVLVGRGVRVPGFVSASVGVVYDVMVDGVLWKASRTRSQEYSVQIELSQKREKSLVAMVEGVDVRRGVKQSTRKFISLPKKKTKCIVFAGAV